MKLQQLFCNHVYKIIEEEYLKTSIPKMFSDFERPIGAKEYYAVTYKCVKCNKIIIKEQARRVRYEL